MADHNSTITQNSYDFTNEQGVALLLTGGVSFFLSLLGSGTIIVLLIKTGKWKTELQHRLVAGMTIIDLMVTSSIAFMPFAVPKETGLLGARGNFTTCEWAGFFFSFYLGGAFYNAALSLYYCLMVTYGWKEQRIQNIMEPWIHLIAFGTPLIIGVTAMVKNMINPNPVNGICTLVPYPADCTLSNDVECQRGSRDSWISAWASLLYILAALGGIYLTIRVYLSVRNQTRSLRKYSISGELDPLQERRIQTVGQQAVLYTVAFLNGFVGVLLFSIYLAILDIESTEELKDQPGVFPINLIVILLFPLQGFWNVLIYIRPRLTRWKQANKDRSWLWVFRMFLTGKAPTAIPSAPTVKCATSMTDHQYPEEEEREEVEEFHQEAAVENESFDACRKPPTVSLNFVVEQPKLAPLYEKEEEENEEKHIRGGQRN